MSKYQGTAKIRVNGAEVESMSGARIKVGGVARTAKVGQEPYGYSEKREPATVTLTIPNHAALSVDDIRKMDNVTVIFEPDSGKSWLLPNAWNDGNPEITDEGDIATAFTSRTAKEI